MKGIKALNVNFDKNTATIYDMKRNPLLAGSKEFVVYVNTMLKDIIVIEPDWELTLFELHKNSNNEWVAKIGVDNEYFIGKAEDITFSKIIDIDKYFQDLKK